MKSFAITNRPGWQSYSPVFQAIFLAVNILLLSIPAVSQYSDEELSKVIPQIKLTDGIHASGSSLDDKWIFFNKDSKQLPREFFGTDALSFWGTNLAYVREPWFDLLKDANIKTIRYDVSWAGMEKDGPASESDLYNSAYLKSIRDLATQGFSLIFTLNDTPSYANGNKNKGYYNQAIAPHKAVEEFSLNGDVLDFSNNLNVQLPHAPGKNQNKPVLYTDLNPFVVLEEAASTTPPITQICEFTNDDERIEDRICILKQTPVKVGSEEVWLDFNGDGVFEDSEKWNRINNWLDLNDPDKLPEHMREIRREEQQAYLISRDGIIKLPSWGLFMFGYGKPIVPSSNQAKKIAMKVTYSAYTIPLDEFGQQKYQEGVDFKLDFLNGVLNWNPESELTIPRRDDSFDAPPISTTWKWINPPISQSIENGNLRIKADNSSSLGTFFYQNVTSPTGKNNDFSASVKISDIISNSDTRYLVGLTIYKDQNNWFRYAFSNPASDSQQAGRPILTQMINGNEIETGGSGAYGFMCDKFPQWITITKKGTSYSAFLSNKESPYTPGSNCSTRIAEISPNSIGPTTPGTPGNQSPAPQTLDFETGSSLKVGISVRKLLNSGAVEAKIDRILIKTPVKPTNNKVRVLYDILDVEAWHNFLNKFANQYGQYSKHWEIWNEPDQGWQWHAKQELMAIMLKVAEDVVHSYDPEAKVIGPGYANSAAAENGYLVISNGMDPSEVPELGGIAWHPYLFSSKSPDADGWYSKNIGALEKIRKDTLLKTQQVSFGEMASLGGAAIYKDSYLGHGTQVDYGTRLLMLARKMPGVLGIQWWPFYDMSYATVGESNQYGSHEGLVFQESEISGNSLFNIPKPMFYAFKNIARNKGFLIDLVDYDKDNNPIPEKKSFEISTIKVGVLDRSKLKSVVAYASLTNTDSLSRPTKLSGKYFGEQWVTKDLKNNLETSINVAPLLVSVNTQNPNFKTEEWYLRPVSSTQFTLIGSESGHQGTASVGEPFESRNKVIGFTIPSLPYGKSYLLTDYFYFETHNGDGYQEIGRWTNKGEVGFGKISLTIPNRMNARYLSVQFEKSGTSEFAIDEIEILDQSQNNISVNKLYLVDGYVENSDRVRTGLPVIDSEPSDILVSYPPYAPDAAVRFSVHVLQSSSLLPPSYQWQKNGVNIAGANSATYDARVTTGDNGAKYRVLITNSNGTTVSREATVNVFRLQITKQPKDTYVEPGQLAVFNVSMLPQDKVTFSYQWQKNGVNIPSGTASSLSLIPTINDDNSLFRVIVSSSAGSIMSREAILNVEGISAENSAPEISEQPYNTAVHPGQSVTFQVNAVGTEPLLYQWERNGINIQGATSKQYSIVPSLSDNGAIFKVVVSNKFGSVTSNGAVLTVTNEDVPDLRPKINSGPSSVTVELGQSASFAVTATGGLPLSYQWRKNNSNIQGATSSQYTFVPSILDNGANLSVVITNAYGSTISQDALLTVNISPLVSDPPEIIFQPKSISVQIGDVAQFRVGASGADPLSYQWTYNGQNIMGANNSTLEVQGSHELNNAKFKVIVRNEFGEVESNEVLLFIRKGAAPLDFDGDGISDFSVKVDSGNDAIYRIKKSSDDSLEERTFAKKSDFPVPGDYDGDGIFDLAVVHRNSNKLEWQILSSSNGEVKTITFGNTGNTVIGGCDFDGDKKADPLVVAKKIIRILPSSGRSRQFLIRSLSSFKIEVLSCVDVNQDGKDDILALVNRKVRGKRVHTVRAIAYNGKKILSSVTSGVRGILTADFNGDGKLEGGFYTAPRNSSLPLKYFKARAKKPISLEMPPFRRAVASQYSLNDGTITGGIYFLSRINELNSFSFVRGTLTKMEFSEEILGSSPMFLVFPNVYKVPKR